MGRFRVASGGGDHCANVAACCEALLRETLLARRLAALAERPRLSAVVARLGVLAALHGIGKFKHGFHSPGSPSGIRADRSGVDAEAGVEAWRASLQLLIR